MKDILLSIYTKFFGQEMLNDISPYINKQDRILDFGCGRGINTFLIQQRLGNSIQGLDIRDDRIFQIPLLVYNGGEIPFSGNSFEVVISSFVLHHTKSAEDLLIEIKKVCGKRIIIYEDTPDNLMERGFCWLHGKLFNGFSGIESPCCFLSKAEWLRLFQKLDLKLSYAKDIKFFNPFQITKRTLFVLEKIK